MHQFLSETECKTTIFSKVSMKKLLQSNAKTLKNEKQPGNFDDTVICDVNNAKGNVTSICFLLLCNSEVIKYESMIKSKFILCAF